MHKTTLPINLSKNTGDESTVLLSPFVVNVSSSLLISALY